MTYIEIVGGMHLNGEVDIQGSKNAVLPILAASILNKGTTKLNHCPKIRDVYHMIELLEELGCKVKWEEHSVIVNASELTTSVLSGACAGEMRSSVIFLGSLLGRMKHATICYPGGCSIGARPIDLHLSSFKKLKVEVQEMSGLIHCETTDIIGSDIHLSFPSVGATENVILVSVLCKGVTKIIGAAKEPEIVELCNYLRAMGAEIIGDGTDQIMIRGVKELHDVEYDVSADRIVAGTYMAALAGAGGNITLHGIDYDGIYSVASVLEDCGCIVKQEDSSLHLKMKRRPLPVEVIRTSPYPGFPTDMQSQLMTVLTIAGGTSVIIENIFETRYKNVNELKKMGADIISEGRVAVVKGVKRLCGAEVFASDLRSGAALVIAGLMAEGKTNIFNVEYISRGYEDICMDFKRLGANIRLVP